jgi:hypothetical protein
MDEMENIDTASGKGTSHPRHFPERLWRSPALALSGSPQQFTEK